MRSVWWQDGAVHLIDQRRLPWTLDVLELGSYQAVGQAIAEMAVRGAPAIGATAGFALALAARASAAHDRQTLVNDLETAASHLKATRPTAVNLAWAVDQLMRVATAPAAGGVDALRGAILQAAQALADRDVEINRRIAAEGARLVRDGDTILHHCNTGALATVDYGTALGVIRMAHEMGKQIHVLLDETRPRLQGARLSAWELEQYHVPYRVITDNAAGHFLRSGEVDLVLVGADRVAANGDVANKIGTYPLAVVAHENGVPFYAVVPTSTIDLHLASGEQIPIEERDAREVTTPYGLALFPESYPVYNPAFDVTPARYVTGIVTENGIAYPPLAAGLRALVGGEASAGAFAARN